MAQLGLQINANLITGRVESYTKNGGTWTRKIDDDRDDISLFSGITNQDTLVCLRYIEEGALVRVIAPKYGRGGNASIAADIFIPSDVSVPGVKLVRIIDMVSAEIHKDQLDTRILEEIFCEQFEVKDSTHQVTLVDNGRIAVREYGEGTELFYQLSQLLDSKYIYQPQYMPYKYVYLIDKSRKIGIGAVKKLDDIQLIESVVFHPIQQIDGFIPYIGDMVFRNPICVYQGEKIAVTWKKENYRDIVKEYRINTTCQLPAINQSEFERIIEHSLFDVRDITTRKQLQKYDLIVNGRRLDPGCHTTVSEDKLKETEIKVYAEGYNKNISTQDVTKRVTLFMEPQTFTYDFSVEAPVGGNPVNFTIKSHGRLDCSPLKGYQVYKAGKPSEGHTNLLIFSPFNRAYKRSLLIKFAIVLLVGIVLGVAGGAAVVLSIKNKPKAEVASTYQPSTTPQSQSQATEVNKFDKNYGPVKDYMDSKKVWDKTELDNFGVVIGLWDAINTYNFEEIKKYAAPLKDCKKFQELINAINANYNKEFPSVRNNPDDEKITIDTYINYLYNKQKSSSSSNSSAQPAAEKTTSNSISEEFA